MDEHPFKRIWFKQGFPRYNVLYAICGMYILYIECYNASLTYKTMLFSL